MMNSRRHFVNLSSAGLFLLVSFYVNAAPSYHAYIEGAPAQHQQPYVEVHNSSSQGVGPREEATAACAVRTRELNATANATVTRRLHGVATSRELRSSIQRLEVIIYGQMQQLWRSLEALKPAVPADRRTVRLRLQPGYM